MRTNGRACEGNGNAALGDLETYCELVAALIALGYRCADFERFSVDRPDLILRHDVDIDLDAAVRMARIERSRGWRATYFMLLTSEFYNLLSRAGRIALKAIQNMGHPIGLHFDPAAYGTRKDFESLLRDECAILERMLDAPVSVIAPHRPTTGCPEWLGWDNAPAGRLHAYQPTFFREAAYVSDSLGYWAYGHPLDHAHIKRGRGVQILTHPHLWIESGIHRDAKIERALKSRMQDLRFSAEEQFSGFKVSQELL